jgi:hypothetical protein
MAIAVALTMSISAAVAQVPPTENRVFELRDLIRRQIYPCWQPVVEAPDLNDLVVELGVTLNKDGTVAKIEPAGIPRNTFARAATRAAMRAIYECQPYKLPPELYEEWKEINPMRFDPRGLVPLPASGR